METGENSATEALQEAPSMGELTVTIKFDREVDGRWIADVDLESSDDWIGTVVTGETRRGAAINALDVLIEALVKNETGEP